MRRSTLAFALPAALAGALLMLSACHKPGDRAQASEPQARAVSVVRVEPRPIRGALAASGDLVPLEEAAVVAEVSGYRVTAVLTDVGQYVEKGQVLARLDPA